MGLVGLGLGPGLKVLGRLGLGLKLLGRPGTETLWDSCPRDSNPLELLGRPVPIPVPNMISRITYGTKFLMNYEHFSPNHGALNK